jgi:Protein of unknown function (DUF732)
MINRRNGLKGLCVAAAVSLASLAAVGTAHADSSDTKFLSLLQNEGITDHISNSHAIEAGHMVCTKLEQGMSPTEVASDILNSSSMPAYHSGYFVGAAIEVYCPQFTPEETKPQQS